MEALTSDDLRTLWFLNTRVSIRVSSRDGSDGVSVLEHRAAYGDSPPLHIHHEEDEIFHVVDGEVRFVVGGTEHMARAGQTLLAPRRIPHTYRVLSPEGARMLTVTRGRFEEFVRSMGRRAESDGLPAPSGPPTPDEADALARACLRFGIELVGPPLS
jgi:quercetin dioxygenase-like cupin family protein